MRIAACEHRDFSLSVIHDHSEQAIKGLSVNSSIDIRLKSFKPIWIPCADRARLMPQKKRSSSSTPNTAADLSLKQDTEYSLFVSHCDGREWDE